MYSPSNPDAPHDRGEHAGHDFGHGLSTRAILYRCRTCEREWSYVRCTATSRRGRQCGQPALPNRNVCRAHAGVWQ
jgi:hypothetical protein